MGFSKLLQRYNVSLKPCLPRTSIVNHGFKDSIKSDSRNNSKFSPLKGGGGGPRHIFLEFQIRALGTTGAPNSTGNFWRNSGTSAPNRL